MTRRQPMLCSGNMTLTALTAALFFTTTAFCLAAEQPDVKRQVLELTGGRRAKVVWNQGDGDSLNGKVRLFDTQTGTIDDLPMPSGTAPLLSADGRYVYLATGKAPERTVLRYDTQTKQVKELARGPGNNLLAVWRDPNTGRDWVYVNDSGDRGEAWNATAGPVYRFPADKPEARELFWDRTSSHIYLMFSADGTRACFEPRWENIGLLTLVYGGDGKVDQDESTYRQLMGGCFPSIAPDNSYRIFSLTGAHHEITMIDADGSNRRNIRVSDMPGVREAGRNVWLTRWSTHPRYLTVMGPAGNDGRIWLGRFDEDCTEIEQWVRIVDEGPQCWQSHAWIADGR